MSKPTYDTTVARIAGTILSGNFDEVGIHRIGRVGIGDDFVVKGAVAMARAIVAEVKRTEPEAEP